MAEEDWNLLGRIPRNSKEEWLIKSGRYWNIDVVDIRLHNNGNPTKKGIRLNMEEIDKLKKILEKVKTDEDELQSSEGNTEDGEQEPSTFQGSNYTLSGIE